MGEFVIKLPDVGEGVAEAELVEWHVKVGDLVREDMILAAVMTDKATVEIPSPVDGEILWLGGEIGQVIAIGSPIIRLKVEGEGHAPAAEQAKPVKAEEPKPQPAKAEPKPEIKAAKPEKAAAPVVHAPVSVPLGIGARRTEGDKPPAGAGGRCTPALGERHRSGRTRPP